MKFGKSLQSQIEETMLDWRPHFIAYIELKKSLKTLQAPVCFSEAAFEEVASSSLEVADQNASSAVNIGGPAPGQRSLLYKRLKNSVKFVDNGLVMEQMSSPDDGPLESAASSVEQFLENGFLGMNGVIENKRHEFVRKGHK
nr:SPX domain-containing protein 4-like [Physcomitrium patens]|eukprot:XP_024361579.1 SPX domain-containing protein 4-like [Physcomitrella patens]